MVVNKLSNTGVMLRSGAEDEIRTRDPQLGRLMLYQLSYFRKKFLVVNSPSDFSEGRERKKR